MPEDGLVYIYCLERTTRSNLSSFLSITPANSSVRIGIMLELPEECVVVFADKNIGAGFYCPLICDLVVDLGAEISILIRGGIIGK